MITAFNTEKATFILPITDIEYLTLERLNQELGAYVLLEVDYETENFTKIDVDFSLIEYNDVNDAQQEVNDIYAYVREYLDVDEEVDQAAWTKESKAYLAESKAEDIIFHKEWIEKLKQEVPREGLTQKRIDQLLTKVTSELAELTQER